MWNEWCINKYLPCIHVSLRSCDKFERPLLAIAAILETTQLFHDGTIF